MHAMNTRLAANKTMTINKYPLKIDSERYKLTVRDINYKLTVRDINWQWDIKISNDIMSPEPIDGN